MRVVAVAVAPGSTEGDARGRDGDVGHASAGRYSRRARAALCGGMTPRQGGDARGDGAGSKASFALRLKAFAGPRPGTRALPMVGL